MTSSKSYITLKEKYDRVVVLIDMDCFYCQVEELLDPKLQGKPIAVVQYVENAGIIAVNYAARARGVTRHMREKEARMVCDDLVCVKVPSKFNKADISKYREAGKRVANVFEKFTTMLERASIDEAYIDITENVAERVQQMRDKKFTLTAQHLNNTYFVGYDNIGQFIHEVSLTVDKTDQIEDDDPEEKSIESSKLRLLIGASIVSDIRNAVKEETGYTCSAGIAHNKILAKLVCGMNKPNKQTIIPIQSTARLFETLEITKIKSMGGKIGDEVCKKLNVKVMSELLPFQESELQTHFGPRIGSFLYLIARGIDLEKVERKVMSKSIAVSKNFRGKNEIMNVNTLKYWLKELSKELKERLDKDQEETSRVSKQMIVQFSLVVNKKDVASSRTVALNGRTVNSFTSDEIGEEAFKTIEKNTPKLVKAEGVCILNNNISHLGISAGKLEDANAGQGSSKSVQDFMKKNYTKVPKVDDENPFAKFEYSPSGSKIETTKSDDVLVKVENPKISKVKASKSEILTPKIKVLSPKTINTARESKTLQISDQKPLDLKSKPLILNSSIKFTTDNSIRGEKTLRHWILQLFLELDKKIKANENGSPSKIKLNWKQIQDDGIKDFSEEVPLNIFTNGINIDFFVNLIKDTAFKIVDEFVPVNYIEIIASELSTESDITWKLNIDEGVDEKENNNVFTDDTQIPDENDHYLTEDIATKFTPTDDFYDENVRPDEMLDMEMNVDDDEEEILKLERSFLGLSPLKSKSNENITNTHEKPTTSISEKSKLSNQPSTSTEQPSTSYQNSYIELQKPSNVSDMLDVLNPLEECLECGKMIRKLDMITHIDGHIAMKISQAQRDEFRAEQKRKILQKINNKSNKKVQKTKTGSTSTQKIVTIDKFTRKGLENETSWDNSILCEICNQLIELDSFQMHQDHHFAQKLRMEQMTVKTNTNSGIKRKRPSSNNKDKDGKSVKSLREFFKQ